MPTSRELRSSTNAEVQVSVDSIPSFTKDILSALSNAEVVTALKNIFNIEELTTKVSKLSDEVAELRKTINIKDTIISNLNEKVQSLEDSLDNLEQYGRRNNLRFHGISEDRKDTDKAIRDVARSSLGIDLKPEDISRSHRIGRPSPGKNRVIMVRFSTYNKRAAIMNNSNKLKNSGMFINEDLTPKRANLLFLARNAKRRNLISEARSRDGKIRIKTLNDKLEIIDSKNRLIELGLLPPDENPPVSASV